MTNNELLSFSDDAQSNRIAEQDCPLHVSSGGRGSHAHQHAKRALAGILCRDTVDPVAPVRDQDATPVLVLETLPAKPFDGDLDLCCTRSYDPTVGRWMTEEPVGFEAGAANLHSYVGNDPIESSK